MNFEGHKCSDYNTYFLDFKLFEVKDRVWETMKLSFCHSPATPQRSRTRIKAISVFAGGIREENFLSV